MSTEGSNFDTVLFVQLCGGEPALYDPSCQGNTYAACKRISRTLEKRGADSRLPPSSVKPVFDRVRAIYEKEAKNRARGGFQELNWYHPMDVYMRSFLSWTQGPNTSENVSDPESTNNTLSGSKPETETQEVSHSVPRSNLEKTVQENGSNQALEKEIKHTNEIPNRKDIRRTSISKVTARKSFNTPAKNSPPKPTFVGKKNEGFTTLEMDASSSTLGCNSNPEAAKSVSVQNELPAEDDPCDVCRSVLPEDENEMLYCDSCNVCVHQACYGVAKVPEGPWFCSPCSMKIKPLCALCPKLGGAMKRTSDERQWAHVSCAWWIKDVILDIPEKMEAINVSKISGDRWKLVCSVCKMKHGVCIQCMVPRCTVAYHVTCAFDKGQTMEILDAQENKEGIKFLTYCKRHHNQIGTLNSQKKKNLKRKYRRSTDVKKTTPRKISSLPSIIEDNINEAITSLVHRNRLSESDSTSDSSLGSGTVSSSSSCSEANERRSSKRVKRSESGGKQLYATSTPSKNPSNVEREPIVPPQNKPLSLDKVLYSFYLSAGSDAHQKTNFECQHCEVQLNKPLECVNERHGKTEPSSNSSSPQGKQKTLYDLPGFVLNKNYTTTPRKSVSDSCATPTAQMDNSKTKSSTTKKKQTFAESRQLPMDNGNHTVGNNSSSIVEEGSSFSRRLIFEHQNENRSFVSEEPLPAHQSHQASTSTAIHCPTDQSSSSSLDHEQTNETHTTPWSKTASIEQLTKTVSIEMQNLSDREAKKLERKIVWLCIKSRRKSESLKK